MSRSRHLFFIDTHFAAPINALHIPSTGIEDRRTGWLGLVLADHLCLPSKGLNAHHRLKPPEPCWFR